MPTSPKKTDDTPRCKCVVLGDGRIGKTCMLHSYAHNGEYLAEKQDYIQTIFENYEADIPVGTGTDVVKLSLWDTAGQEEFDELRRMCYGEGATGTGKDKKNATSFDVQAFIVCFALDDQESFTNVEMKWYREIRRVATELMNKMNTGAKGGKGAPSINTVKRPFAVILVGTKCDLVAKGGPVARDGKKGVTEAQAKDLQRRMGADAYLECSAKTGENIPDVINAALATWWEKREEEQGEDDREVVTSGGKKKGDKDGCAML